MTKMIVKILRYIAGVLLIIIGTLLGLAPIPVIPFFLITLFGLHLLGVDTKVLEKVKKFRDKDGVKNDK